MFLFLATWAPRRDEEGGGVEGVLERDGVVAHALLGLLVDPVEHQAPAGREHLVLLGGAHEQADVGRLLLLLEAGVHGRRKAGVDAPEAELLDLLDVVLDVLVLDGHQLAHAEVGERALGLDGRAERGALLDLEAGQEVLGGLGGDVRAGLLLDEAVQHALDGGADAGAELLHVSRGLVLDARARWRRRPLRALCARAGNLSG
jgi:hypothetical protein